jgi:hypothetical protein
VHGQRRTSAQGASDALAAAILGGGDRLLRGGGASASVSRT